MPSDAEQLVSHFNAALPRIKDCWQEHRQRGYDERKQGKPRKFHGRGGRKGMWLLGWDEADKEIRDA